MSLGSQKKFLIIKLSALGDIVHALPVARTLRQAYPDAFIAWMIEERYPVSYTHLTLPTKRIV